MANATWVKQRGLQAKLGRYWVQGKADQTAWRSPQTPPHVICLIETAAFSPVNNPHTEAVAAAREQIYQSMSRASAYAGGSIYLLFIWGFIQPRSWHKVSPASHKIRRWFFNSRRVAPKILRNSTECQEHANAQLTSLWDGKGQQFFSDRASRPGPCSNLFFSCI